MPFIDLNKVVTLTERARKLNTTELRELRDSLNVLLEKRECLMRGELRYPNKKEI